MIPTISRITKTQIDIQILKTAAFCLWFGIVIGFGFHSAIEPDARTQALDWFARISLEEQSDFIYVQLGSNKKRQWIAHRWCSLNPGDDWACGKAGMGSPVFKGGK